MEKIQANMCFDVVFLYINIRTYLFTRYPYFLHVYSAHLSHYITMVKGLLKPHNNIVRYIPIIKCQKIIQKHSWCLNTKTEIFKMLYYSAILLRIAIVHFRIPSLIIIIM